MTNINETTTKQRPTHSVYITSTKADSNETNWLQVGAAWAHKDNQGFNLSIDHVSPNGQYVLRKRKTKAE